MRKLYFFFVVAVVAAFAMASCSKYETYADKKKKENAAINAYLAKNNVKVLTEKEFAANGNKTDVSKNEFVLFESNGVYLQIVRKGVGEPIKDGESVSILCRFKEYNLLTDTIQLSNDEPAYGRWYDRMTVSNTSGTFTGSFDTNQSLMYSAYTSASVPSGWLHPLTYVNIGIPVTEDDEIAKINIIVPSAQGQYYASSNVYPCLYELKLQREE